jgi:hypothetical protein
VIELSSIKKVSSMLDNIIKHHYRTGMDLLARGGAGGGAIFHDKAKKLLETK